MGMLKAVCTNDEFEVLEDVYGAKFAKVSGTVTNVATNILVAGAGSKSARIFTVGDVVLNNRTGERMVVTAIVDDNNITVIRQQGSTVAAAMVDSDSLFIIGNASAQGSGATNVNETKIFKTTNYTQIFKTSFAVTGTEKESKLYGGDDLRYKRQKKGTEHAIKIEQTFWFGEKFTTTDNGKKKSFTGGVFEFLNQGNSYIQDQNGVLTAPDFNTFLRNGFVWGQKPRKTLFAGGKVLQAVNEIARGQILMKPNEQSYGMEVSEWRTPFGVINMVHVPPRIWGEDNQGTAVLVDMESFRYRFYQNRDTRLKTNIQAPDVDGEIDAYETECGLERKQAPYHAIIKNVEA